jgi:hypothetical protein
MSQIIETISNAQLKAVFAQKRISVIVKQELSYVFQDILVYDNLGLQRFQELVDALKVPSSSIVGSVFQFQSCDEWTPVQLESVHYAKG